MLKIGIFRKLLQPLKKPTAQEKFLQKPLMYKDIFIIRTIRQFKIVMTEKYTTKSIIYYKINKMSTVIQN